MWQLFRPTKSLAGKPKIFIIQACRGDKEDVGWSRGIGDEQISTDNSEIAKLRLNSETNLPDMSDFLIAYTTTPGYVSWRSKTEGTWYISELCDLLETKHKECDLMTILTMVNNRIASKMTDDGFKQMPAPVTYLRGSIYIV